MQERIQKFRNNMGNNAMINLLLPAFSKVARFETELVFEWAVSRHATCIDRVRYANISATKLNTLLELGAEIQFGCFSVDDGVLRSVKDFVRFESARRLCERVLTLVQQGEWSQEERYNTWLADQL